MNIDTLALDTINILYTEEKYDEALEGLKLLKRNMTKKRYSNNSEGLKMIDDLIRICELKKSK
jgi:hypothetical protein